ncbi:C1 family peptidase [Maribacter sp. Asnod2-G09]|uniref:C1 family peptidase n=1 Tax=Maribacter sp. Asnod2-G09 TaxID=3160577 RepID=UPI003868DFAA
MRTLLFISFFISCISWGQNQPRTGLLFDDEAYEKTPLKARNVAFQDVVTEISSTSLKQFVPTIKDQGGYGTCVGWSSAYYGRTILEARLKNIKEVATITENAFSPVFTYLNANVQDDYNCQGGAFIGKAMETMVDKGVPYYKDFNVMCETTIPESLLEIAGDNKIKDFTRIFGADEPEEVKVDGVKRSLLNGNPVIIGFKVENSFYSAKTVFEPDNLGTDVGHAMCVIGYDDDKYGGSFEIVNSWGPTWGNDGFMWIRYEDFPKYTRYAFEMIPNTTEPKEKTILAGELELILRDGSNMNVNMGKSDYTSSVYGFQQVVVEEEVQSIGDYSTEVTYPKGTRYRIKAKVNTPSYVYVLGVDKKNPSSLLFPHNDSISPYINAENAEVIIPYTKPNAKVFFALNEDVESDYTVVIFSLEKIDLPNVKKQLDEMEGELLDKFYVIFKDKLINKDEIELNEEKIGFKAEFDEGSMAMMILDIKRS